MLLGVDAGGLLGMAMGGIGSLQQAVQSSVLPDTEVYDCLPKLVIRSPLLDEQAAQLQIKADDCSSTDVQASRVPAGGQLWWVGWAIVKLPGSWHWIHCQSELCTAYTCIG